MTRFMSSNYLLKNNTAQELYSCVENLPIFDYHCHLSEIEIYNNRTFSNIGELWLECDHYKWRVMRNFGIDERFITADATYKEKFIQFAKAIQSFAGNPVYHWCHLELKKYFGIDEPLNADNAERIFDLTEKMMQDGSFSARELIVKSKVDTLITTDDPLSNLDYHKKLKEEEARFSVLPCFRPDVYLNINDDFFKNISKLSQMTGIEVKDIPSLLSALENRLEYFIANGCVVADVAFENFPKCTLDIKKANKVFKGKMSDVLIESYRYHVIKGLVEMFSRHDIILQLHVGVIRNQNSVLFNKLGKDVGNDSVANVVDINLASKLFDDCNKTYGLPRTIVYTLNPTAYMPISTLLGNFAGKSKGSMQLGAAWWFMDHKDGIYEQLKVLSSTSGLGIFNGMLTDSRSFTSYARHDYFRRILCSLVGEWVEGGEYPLDEAKKLVSNVSFYNSKNYFVR